MKFVGTESGKEFSEDDPTLMDKFMLNYRLKQLCVKNLTGQDIGGVARQIYFYI